MGLIIRKVTNLTYLEKTLQILVEVGKSTDLNLLKQRILANAELVIKHYLSVLFAQSKEKELREKIVLLANFTYIVPNNYTTEYGQIVAGYVTSDLVAYVKKLEVYKKLQDLLEQEQENTVRQIEPLTAEKILFFKVEGKEFTLAGIKKIITLYPKWKQDKDFGELFKELFLQVGEEDANFVKDFLIKNQEYELLIRLFEQFPKLRLTKENIQAIYEGKNLFWLERMGINIVTRLRMFTGAMFSYFTSILSVDAINGYHTGYARNIFNGLILPVIDMFGSSANVQVHKLPFLQLISKFLQFSVEHALGLILNSRQLEMIFRLCENVLNDPMLSSEMLDKSLDYIIHIARSLKLNLINMESKLLILEPKSDVSIELAVPHQATVISLLVQKIANPDVDMSFECNQVIAILFSELALQTTPQFAITVARYQPSSANIESTRLNHKRKRTESF